MASILIKNMDKIKEEPINETKQKYLEILREKNGKINFKYTRVHLSPKKFKEFYSESGIEIINDIRKHWYDVEIMEERFPPPLEIDTVAGTFHDNELLILISKESWNDLRKAHISDRSKDPSLPKWSEIKKYYILDILIHEFTHIIMHEREPEYQRKKIEKYEFKIDRESRKINPNTRFIERLSYKIEKMEHGRKFNKIYNILCRKYLSNFEINKDMQYINKLESDYL